MYQHELIGIANMKMLQAIRNRDAINSRNWPEERGYWHGTYKAYEEILQILMMMDVKSLEMESPIVTPTT